MSDIGKHIMKYRKARGLSQDELAERILPGAGLFLGLNRSEVSK